MLKIRRYSTADHDDIWRLHLLVIAAAGVEPTHQHYHDIFHIDEQYLSSGGEFLVGTAQNGMVVAMGGLKKLDVDAAEIKRLRVHPDFQQRGYGQLILSRLEERAAELGFGTLPGCADQSAWREEAVPEQWLCPPRRIRHRRLLG